MASIPFLHFYVSILTKKKELNAEKEWQDSLKEKKIQINYNHIIYFLIIFLTHLFSYGLSEKLCNQISIMKLLHTRNIYNGKAMIFVLMEIQSNKYLHTTNEEYIYIYI